MNETLITLEGIEFSYSRSKPVFSGLNFQLHRGERVGIIGANGSGKTTLFHLIMGLQRAQAGGLFAFGREVKDESDFMFVRERVGFLFQDSEDQLFCPTVIEDVAFGPMNLGKSKAEALEIAREALASLGLSGYEDRITYELSGGEKRLVALATVLAMQPEVLLLDEPSNGLDPGAKRDLVALLGQIGGTQVISSHDMEFVRATSLRVVLIDRGRVLADGATDEVLGNAALMLAHGLEVPFSLVAQEGAVSDHRHGAGPGHGHGHDLYHPVDEHRIEDAGADCEPLQEPGEKH